MVTVSKVMVEEQEAPIHGDILEAILSHVPLTDLVPASCVSKAWKRAVFSSLRNFNRLKPWLIVHTQSSRSPYATTTHAYDPRSHVWVEIRQPPIRYVSALRSSHSNLLYMLSPSKLSFSFDPLHLTWHHVDAPLVWRTDPIVALVGHRIVVAGGACDFEDDPLAVEIYDVESRTWDTCQSMPAVLKDSAASTWLSVASNNHKLFVIEKHSGVTHVFDPETKTWYGPYDLRPDQRIFFSVIAFSSNRLVLVGLIGGSDTVESLKLWEVDCETFECREIGEMPLTLVEKLKTENFQLSSVSVCLTGNFVYLYNPLDVELVFVCEFVDGGCMWRSIRNVVANDRTKMERFVLTCSTVGIDEVKAALRSENRRFVILVVGGWLLALMMAMCLLFCNYYFFPSRDLDVTMDPVCSVVGKILELSVEPIWNNISYIFNHKKNIENLRGHIENLEARRNGMQGSIDAAIRNREEIRGDVKFWIEKVDLIKQESTQFLRDDATNVNKKCFHGWFPDLITRYQVGKKAAKKILEIQHLQGEGKFENISFDAPPPGIRSMSARNFVAYKTTEMAMMKVIEALKDTNIDLIGIHGMGGVGKTTLVKEIGKKGEEEKLFKEVVMAVVSQNIDLKKIQGQIADMLGLKFESESDTGRANELRNRLNDATLIILDDVWERVNVEDIGIPFPFDEAHKNCKIVITTRREQVCHVMGTRRESTKIICLDVLSEEESWDLFKRNVGDIVESPTLNTVAKNVFQECRGLPLALVTVGRAMKSKDKPEEWIEAAQELKKSMPTNIEGVDKEVYKSLKLSYDYLKDEETKTCFLLCCLFPEDHNIFIEDLVRYGIGLRIFKNVDTLQEARRRVNTVIKNLQDSCLLLTSEPASYDERCDAVVSESGFTKMHDIVRDVAISIAVDKYFVRAGVNLEEWPNMETLGSYNGISLMCNRICNGLPVSRELLQKLQILLVQDNESLFWSYSDELFSRLKALTVLDMSNTVATVQPHRLTNNCFGDMQYLRTLILNDITVLDNNFLENFKSLEVLSFKRCWFEIPINMIEKLTNLRLLDLTGIKLDHIIPANVISQLSRLEELHMFGSIIDWIISCPIEIAGLQSLSRLKVLSMSLDATLIGPEDFTFPDWETFLIDLGVQLFGPGREVSNANFMSLENILVQAMMLWPKWVKRLFKRTNRLRLDRMKDLKNILPDLSFVGDNLNVLKQLHLSSAIEFEYLINTKEWSIPPMEHNQQVLSNLEKLRLYQLHSFKGICHGSY
ncbi:hypothetical protein F0562_033303 [Nyssa sinensis]|uniref:F-box domain-containing protein n=1 Tax=Nyssa sinensis TaxID=561372 RepID=A0A5J5ASD4_9ASTE|nr:hypothetical protein F0562_033303 [Nyssa sinensis]